MSMIKEWQQCNKVSEKRMNVMKNELMWIMEREG